MEIYIQHKLNNYLNLLNEIKKVTEDTDTAQAMFREIAKDIRMERNPQNRQQGNGYLATPAQISYLKRLGAVVPRGLTKAQASQLIESTKMMDPDDSQLESPIRVP